MEKGASEFLKSKVIDREKIFSSLLKQVSYDDCLKLIPKNSMGIIVQFNKLKNKVYFSMVQSDSDPTIKKFLAKTHELSESNLKTYL
jgi:hypothetical protein